MRDVRQPGNHANIPRIRLGVQDQRLDGSAGWHLAIGPPGQGTRFHLTKAQRDWLAIVRPDFDNYFRHRPGLRARLSQVQDALVIKAVDPERPAPDQVHVGIHSEVVKMLRPGRGLRAQFCGGEASGVVTGAGPVGAVGGVACEMTVLAAVAVGVAREITVLADEQLVRSNTASRLMHLPKAPCGG